MCRFADEVEAVALVVDPDDSLLDAIMSNTGISMLQLHGVETTGEVEIKDRTGLTMKAVKVSESSDLDAATAYFRCSGYAVVRRQTYRFDRCTARQRYFF